MKKVFAILLMVVVMVVMIGSACGESQQAKVMNDMRDYIEENNLEKWYNDQVDEFGVYSTCGFMDIALIMKEFNIQESLDDFEYWFVDWYEPALMERFPQYGEVGVVLTKVAVYNGTTIYHMTVAAEHDLVEFVDGEQNIVDMLFAIY